MLIKHESGYEVESPEKIAKKLIKKGSFSEVKKEEPKKEEKKVEPKKADKK